MSLQINDNRRCRVPVGFRVFLNFQDHVCKSRAPCIQFMMRDQVVAQISILHRNGIPEFLKQGFCFGHGFQSVRIPGVYHTVNPVANDEVPVYKENTREYSLLRTENFGTVLQMEVGALLVGKIVNHRRGNVVRRGQEKGMFAFGGSTILLMTQKGKVSPDRDLMEYSRQGIETMVRQGETVGRAAGKRSAG